MLQITEFTQAALTQQSLRELLHYEPATGIFTWLKSNNRRRVAGSVAGHRRPDRRVVIGIDGRLYFAHRLAWLWVHGTWPPAGIDHRSTDAADNRIDNLRPATQAENMQNLQRPHRDSRIGFLGVQASGKTGFRARVKAGLLTVTSKRFDTPEEAHAAYREIKALFHPFAHIERTAA